MEEVNALVNRINTTLSGTQQGFINCTVQSYQPVVLAYNFSDHYSANLFQLQRSTLINAIINASNPNTVLIEHQI